MSAIEERSPKRRRTSYSPVSPPLQEKHFHHDAALHTPPPSVHMSPSWQTQSLPSNTAGDNTIPPTPSSTTAVSQIKGEDETQKDVDMSDPDLRRTDHERIELPPPPLLYRSDREPFASLQPDLSKNLIEVYSLQALQASVARRDPVTGEKINKLRKSYETKSRNLGVEGRNKATAQEGHLQGFVDPLWDAEVSGGMTMWDQKMENVHMDKTDELLASLDNALKLKPGRLPRAEYNEWRQQLGLDDAITRPPIKDHVPEAPPISPSGTRPDRAGKKRRYDESSYEGYDDDLAGGGTRRVKRKVSGF